MLSREEGEQLAAELEEVQAQLQHVSIAGGTSQVRHQVAAGSLPLSQPPSPPMEDGEVRTEEARQTQHIRREVQDMEPRAAYVRL